MPIDLAAKMSVPDEPVVDELPEEDPVEDAPAELESETSDAPAELESEEDPAEEPELEQEEAIEPAPEAPKLKAGEIKDEAKFTIDGKEVTGKELKAGFLRQEDYTRKTQALAEERRALTTERDSLKEENEEFVEWVRSFDDPDTMRFELIRNFPAAYDALRDHIISQALEDQDLDATALAWKRRAEKAEVFQKAKEQDEARARTKEEKQAQVQRTSELRATFNTWAAETLAGAGLDPKSKDHQELVRARVQQAFPANQHRWTKEHFQLAAAYIAKQLGKTPPVPPKAKPNLPPTKPQGNRATVEQKTPKIKEKKDTGEGFSSLRAKYGLQ